MPIVTGKTTKPLDPQAVSGDRSRRNWQTLVTGGVNGLLTLANNGGLIATTGGLSLNLNPAGALSIVNNQLGVNVDGVTITIVDDKLVGAPSGPSFQQVEGLISLGI